MDKVVSNRHEMQRLGYQIDMDYMIKIKKILKGYLDNVVLF